MTTSPVAPHHSADGDLTDRIALHFSKGYPGTIPPNQALEYVTRTYLDSLDPADPPAPAEIEQRLLALTNGVYADDNERRKPGNKTPLLRRLTPYQIAQCLLRLHHVVNVSPVNNDTDREYDVLSLYVASGFNRGVHTSSEEDIKSVARHYDTQMSINDGKEILAILKQQAPRTHVCQHRELVAVDNGIFNFSQDPVDAVMAGRRFRFEPKSLHPFDPAFVFLTKSHVALDPMAESPVYDTPDGDQWEVEDWMRSLSDDPEQVELLWQILGAIVRPHVRWNKTAWFYSEQGNNGKGTLCALMRNLVGAGAHTSIPLSEFGKDFALEPLLRASAIIVDENDVGTFVDQAANLKAIVTNDVVQINRKYRMPIAFQFWGFMVQCLNEFPRVKDKSDSFYRRQLFVPFEKCFTGQERKYIKNDYLNRPDVLRYVLKRVLVDMTYYELSEPASCRAVLAEYKEFNDPVRAFWAEFASQLVWDLVPFSFGYDLYRAWFTLASPSGSPVSRNAFIADLVAIVRTDPDWYCADKNKQVRPGQAMNQPEPLIAEYDLKKWANPTYKGSDPLKKSQPLLATSYRGIQRIAFATGGAATRRPPVQGDDEPVPGPQTHD